MSTWEQRMAERALQRRLKEREDRLSMFGPMPAEVPPCCVEWQLDEDHGWMMFQTCREQTGYCDHEHHRGEVWLAA